jgi:leucyl aminopeptidase (aminopeptidase T)
VRAEETTPPSVARVLITEALQVRRGEAVVIETWNHTLPWAAACVAEVRRRGAHPLLLLEDESAYWKSIDLAPAIGRWSGSGKHESAALRRSDAYLYFPGPADRPRLHALPPAQLSPILRADDGWTGELRKAGVRALRCMLGYSSDQQADRWGVPGAMWRSQLLRGIAETDYRQVRRDAQRVAQRLQRGRELRVTATNGTDLTLRLKGRSPWIDDGIVDPTDLRAGHNIATAPPGAVVVALDERSAEGTAIASRPSFLSEGRADGGQWEIQGGRLLQYWYTDGASAFEAEFGRAPRGREIVSLFSIGLNAHLPASVPQAEDNEAGAVTLALGGNTLYGGTNRCDFLSWIVIGEATVAVDGKALCDRGSIL